MRSRSGPIDLGPGLLSGPRPVLGPDPATLVSVMMSQIGSHEVSPKTQQKGTDVASLDFEISTCFPPGLVEFLFGTSGVGRFRRHRIQGRGLV